MDPNQLAQEFRRTALRSADMLIDAAPKIADLTFDKLPIDAVVVSAFDLRVFANSIANNLAMGIAHRVAAEDHCSDCGEELDAELVFVLRNGKRLHPGCL